MKATQLPLAEKAYQVKRRSAPKSRQGCLRCKARRVKCDEGRPGCAKCISYGSQCPGYHQNLRWSSKHENQSRVNGSNTLPDVQENRCTPQRTSESITSSPFHLPTFLIEHWFRRICPMRSTFDSNINYNRSLASGTWASSEPVYYTLQAMSAACLAESMPEVKVMLNSLSRAAIGAIRKEISHINDAENPEVTVDLVFATFAMGASLHWMNPKTFEMEWLGYARRILSLWKTAISPMYGMLQAHFSQALTYWEMCIKAAGHGSSVPEMEQRPSNYRGSQKTIHVLDLENASSPTTSLPGRSGLAVWSTRPNSWCGVSEEIIYYFGQALELCHRALSVGIDTFNNPASLSNEASYVRTMAGELYAELQSLDPSMIVQVEEAQGLLIQTQDIKTPVHHLTSTAEAYRQAALLQLHLAFSDLGVVIADIQDEECSQLPSESRVSSKELAVREELLLHKAVQLVSILKDIPVESGSSTIHPILYLSAAAALRLDSARNIDGDSHTPLHQETHTADESTFGPLTTANWVSRVSVARDFILDRLSTLQKMLPHRSSDGMLQLVKALWAEYDNPHRGASSVHWMSLMNKRGLVVTLR